MEETGAHYMEIIGTHYIEITESHDMELTGAYYFHVNKWGTVGRFTIT